MGSLHHPHAGAAREGGAHRALSVRHGHPSAHKAEHALGTRHGRGAGATQAAAACAGRGAKGGWCGGAREWWNVADTLGRASSKAHM